MEPDPLMKGMFYPNSSPVDEENFASNLSMFFYVWWFDTKKSALLLPINI